MAKLDYEKIFIKDACPTSIGGQAIMEGVMMQGPDRLAIAMRLPNGELYLKTKKKPKPSALSKIPLIRGCVNFFKSLIQGTGVLMESADILEKFAPEEYNEEPGKFERWLNEHFGEKAVWNILMTVSVVIAFVISIAVFVIFPTIAVNWMKKITQNAILLNLVEGLLRLALFLLYTLAISKMEDIHTLFQYHGSEHKSIHCFENNLELTPENAQTFPTLHPRCGTSFLMFVFIIALILFSFLGWPDLLMRILSRLLLLPVIAGVSYELLKWAGRSDGKVVRILSYPGLLLQKLTTAEPTLEQLEVAIVSLKAVLVDPDTPVGEGFVDKDANWLADFKEEDFLPDAQQKSYQDALRWGIQKLKDIDNGKNEARIILCYVTKLKHTELITRGTELMSAEDLKNYRDTVEARLAGKPLQYILGYQKFMGHPIKVDPSVLIPRMETEVLVDSVIKVMNMKKWERPAVLDMCTGSGAIGISIACAVPDSVVTMTDVSKDALEMADYNARLNKINHRCIFSCGDLFDAIDTGNKYDVFVANPPYIESAEVDKLMPEVKDHEPRIALDGGVRGLDYYARIIARAHRFIKSGGIIAFEIGNKQANAVTKMLKTTERYDKISVLKDLAGRDRIVIAERI